MHEQLSKFSCNFSQWIISAW